jgi:hypothetical protein
MLKLFAFSKYRFDKEEKISALLRHLSGGPFPPSTFGRSEPITQKLTPNNRSQLDDILLGTKNFEGGSLFLSSKNLKSTSVFQWAPNTVSDWYSEFSTEVLARQSKTLVEYLRGLFSEFPVVFAGIALDSDWDKKHWIVEEDEDGGELVTKVGLNLEYGLPGIYWITVFGSELLEHFDREVLTALPCYQVVNLGDSGIMLVLSDSPDKISQSHEEEIIRTLGKEYFFDISNPDSACKKIIGLNC